jgi:hypothetical protein
MNILTKEAREAGVAAYIASPCEHVHGKCEAFFNAAIAKLVERGNARDAQLSSDPNAWFVVQWGDGGGKVNAIIIREQPHD